MLRISAVFATPAFAQNHQKGIQAADATLIFCSLQKRSHSVSGITN
jgi:hypothetical protein